MDMRTLSSSELSRLCVNGGDADAWLEFVRRFQKPIALTALRICQTWGMQSRSVVDDLVQETYLRLCADQCRLLRNFSVESDNPDPLGALVRAVAANVAHDFFRNRTAQKRGGAQSDSALELPDDELLSDLWGGARDLERELQIREIEQVLRSAPSTAVSPRERLIFRLYFRQGLTASAIAMIPAIQLTVKGVESALHRITQFLRSQLNPAVRNVSHFPQPPEGKAHQFPMKEEGA
jgi:RNA polymerase sigma-70 factor (ECF subfamily)